MDPAIVVWTEEIEDLATGDDDFLALAAGEAAIDGTDDAGGTLQSETVEIHGVGWLGFNLGFWFQLNIHSKRVLTGEEDGRAGIKTLFGVWLCFPSIHFYITIITYIKY